MRLLAEVKRLSGSRVDLHVLFHRYLGNHDNEARMRQFAEELGFRFEPVWAYLMPLEKNLAYLGEEGTGTSITSDDLQLIESLALRLTKPVKPCSPTSTRRACCNPSDWRLTTKANSALLRDVRPLALYDRRFPDDAAG